MAETMIKTPNDDRPKEEAERRFTAALKRALNTPPKPHKPLKKAKRAKKNKQTRS